MLVVFGFLALTFIVLLPTQAGAHAGHSAGGYLDGAGSASLENSPVVPVEPSPAPAPRQKDAGSSATTSGGGLGVPGLPVITNIVCLRQCVSSSRATRGAIIAIRGNNLNRVKRIFFRAKKGRIAARYRTRSIGAVRVTVPKRTVRGFLAVIDTGGNRARSPRELAIFPVSAIPVQAFPVRGPFSFGSSGSRFGAGRPGHIHQGQDLSASCGVPLVSIKRARVLYNRWDGGGGNYVVLHNIGTRTNFVYMHMIRRSPLRVGQVIGAGTRIGRVGTTGSSSGCHLHFESWVGPWQTGGRPIDPLPYLKSLLRKKR